MVPYVVMDTHMLSAVFLRWLILSISQTVITLKTKPHLPIAAHTVHAVRWSDCGAREIAGDHSQSQASFLPCTGYSPVISLQIQSLLRLTPAGRGDRTTRVTTHTVTATGFRSPVRPWGFSPWFVLPPPPGWACSHTSDPPRHLATASQWHTARLSRSGSGRSVFESGTLSAPSAAPPVPSHTQVRSSVSAPWDHYPSATQTSGALLPAYGTSPSLECDSGHMSSPPTCGSGYDSVLGYGHSHAKRCDLAGSSCPFLLRQ